ncbi:MAG TPA: four helix bundle suffix domain-containing protein [Planctomycetota bacterium]|nr:four helix bundle suffix domain-containing protein [Planctomycetota bacterium]HRR81840.1 four helix bundle suffix domain-containing protein [Planctomycetota bacterium]HRT97509.1 four helix bundle suffix domain-containing protein [Planctomycetota bacterium]
MAGKRLRHGELIIGPHGGYRKLKSFQVTTIVYDGTAAFCERFFPASSRMREQMVHAARSAKQNLAEGSTDSATSRKTELKLTGVALGSLGELIEDYGDFLRQRGLRVWEKECPEAHAVRALARVPDRSCETYRARVERGTPEVSANTMLCLANQAQYLVRQQLRGLAERFAREGGVTERMYRARREARGGLM